MKTAVFDLGRNGKVGVSTLGSIVAKWQRRGKDLWGEVVVSSSILPSDVTLASFSTATEDELFERLDKEFNAAVNTLDKAMM